MNFSYLSCRYKRFRAYFVLSIQWDLIYSRRCQDNKWLVARYRNWPFSMSAFVDPPWFPDLPAANRYSVCCLYRVCPSSCCSLQHHSQLAISFAILPHYTRTHLWTLSLFSISAHHLKHRTLFVLVIKLMERSRSFQVFLPPLDDIIRQDHCDPKTKWNAISDTS